MPYNYTLAKVEGLASGHLHDLGSFKLALARATKVALRTEFYQFKQNAETYQKTFEPCKSI